MMATGESYEPTRRLRHACCSVDGGMIIGGGRGVLDFESIASREAPQNDDDRRIYLGLNSIDKFDSYLEIWSRLDTTGTPHPGLLGAACASVGDYMYMYGGHNGASYKGDLSLLNLKTLTWSQLSQEAAAGGPMRKDSCGIFICRGEQVVVIGGYGIPTGPAQTGASFIQDTRFTDGCGWTNEVHVYDIKRGIHLQN